MVRCNIEGEPVDRILDVRIPKGTKGYLDMSSEMEYLEGARDVINNGYAVNYEYKGETRVGYIQFMGNDSKGNAKFAFVGTNNYGNITTFHTESGKSFLENVKQRKYTCD